MLSIADGCKKLFKLPSVPSLREFPEVGCTLQIADKSVDLGAHVSRGQSTIVQHAMQVELLRGGVEVKERWFNVSVGDHQGLPLRRRHAVRVFDDSQVGIHAEFFFVVAEDELDVVGPGVALDRDQK